MNPKCIPHCTMREALDDPNIFGTVLAGESWAAWRVILIACRGEPLTDTERVIFTALTGREREPDAPCDEVWGKVGRRGGKTRAFAVLGAYLAALIDYSAIQAPGERLKLPIMAATNKQATKAFTYLVGIFKNSSDLEEMLECDPTQDTISLKQGVDIEVTTASFRTARGETLIAVLCDEIAFWHLEGSANPDTEILNAARPGLITTGGPMAVFSSPYARKGELYKTFEREYGPNGDPGILVLSAPSLTMNPGLDRKLIERARARDPAVAAAEYDAEFRKDVEAFISIEAFRACLDGTATERLPDKAKTYRAFVDVSGGGADAMTLAIGHKEGDLAVLDVAREMPAGTPPAAVVEAFSELLKAYGVKRVRGDRYGKEWVQERFRAESIDYEESPMSKSDIYAAFLPVLNSQRCKLLAISKLQDQMVALERRTTRGTGRDIIDHPQRKGAHDDLANAACGVIVMLSQGSSGRSLMDLYDDSEVSQEADRRLERWFINQGRGF